MRTNLKITGNTILITGGSSGIGFALASSFSNQGNEVIICGRREEKLRRTKEKLPKISVKTCDVSNREDIESLVSWVTSNFPKINVLVNNAGIQRAIDLKKGIQEISANDDEIAINLNGAVELSEYFIPLFLKRQTESAIVNVSSGLGFVPLAKFPIYCATKAAIHSFTMSMRFQLKDTPIKVFEVIPPIVYDTELKGKPLEKAEWSVSSAEVADASMKGMEKDDFEIPIGPTKNWVRASRSDLDQDFNNMNGYS
jgi:uncharacterized oxidoreductase